MSNFLIRNATLINEGRVFEADLRVRGERIEQIGGDLSAREDERVIDAHGKWLMPGMIDDQVHFREPGLTHKGDMASESRAAVAGGITTVMEMPNTKPATLTLEALEDKFELARGRMATNFAFYLGASNDNLEQIKRLQAGHTCGIKIFMGASTGNMLVDDPKTLEAIFREAKTVLITHCEDTPRIDALQAEEIVRFGEAIDATRHPHIRDDVACYQSTELAVGLARKHNAQLHVLHISTAKELTLFEPGPMANKSITAETCVHFLHFDAHDYPRLGNFIKCNPSIKFDHDRQAIVHALAEGRIDILATDHAPHTLEEKQQPYLKAPSGLPLVQSALQCAFERYFAGQLSRERIVETVCHAPAQRFKVKDRGFLREGFFADLTLIDPHHPQLVTREDVRYRCGWSPFEGHTFRTRIHNTFVNGERVYDSNTVRAAAFGQRLKFST